MAKDYEIECFDEWINDRYRYRLDVRTGIASRKRLVVIQINPSRAGQRRSNGTIRSDSTIGKVSVWAQENGFGLVTFLNLFAYVATNQRSLTDIPFRKLVGSQNDTFIATSINNAGKVVVAWGRPDRNVDLAAFDRRVVQLKALLGNRRVYAVGNPVEPGFPRHGRLWNTGNRFLREFKWPVPRTV
jgi:hypothetical protein